MLVTASAFVTQAIVCLELRLLERLFKPAIIEILNGNPGDGQVDTAIHGAGCLILAAPILWSA